MTWLPIIALAALACVVAVVVLKLPRSGITLFGAALLFGLAGYGAQGSPGLQSAPREGVATGAGNGELLVQARREFYGPTEVPSRFVITSDAFTRRGNFVDAASFLRNALRDNPNDGEAWLALGNVLVEHAEGQLTPAALYAYSRSERIDPTNPAPTYFLGLAHLRAGRPLETRKLWAELLANAPADARWRPALDERLKRLDLLIEMAVRANLQQEPAPEQ